MSERTIGNITFDDIENLERFLANKSGIRNIDLDDVIDFIENEVSTKFYFDKSISGCEERDATYVWLDTGFLDERKRPLFISCLNHQGYFKGHIVGDANSLTISIADHFRVSENVRREKLERFNQKYTRKIEKRTTKNLVEKYKTKSDPKAPVPDTTTKAPIVNTPSQEQIKKYWNNDQVLDITKEIKDLLIINKWNSIQGLDRYIKVIGARLAQLVNAGKKQFYELNKIKSAICNTGLLNHFGEDIYVLYRMNLSYGFYSPYKVILDKTQYLDEGFTKEQSFSKLEPITFFDDANHGFNVKIEDINFNQHDWLHIIEERRSRFPDDLRNVPNLALITQIKQSLDIGLKLQKCDGSYAKPIYSASTGSVSWVLPFFANGDFMSKPELVMVLAKFGEFYQLKTILPYDDEVKDKMMDMSIYSRMW